MTPISDDWSRYYVDRTKAVPDGSRTFSNTRDGLDKGKVVMGPHVNMPDDVKAMAVATEAAVKAGTANAFKCPILDQDG